MNPEENPWQTLSGKLIYDNPWIQVNEYDVINPKGGKGIYGKVSFKGLAIGVIPVDEAGNTWLVGQYRYTLNEYSWEIPMGGVPFDEDVEAGALRELREETGLTAGRLEYLSKIHTSNSVTDEEGHIYIAKELTEGATEFDDTEDLAVRKLPFKAALDMVLNGEITDSLSVAGILKYARQIGI
ncbi:MAG: hypothetical protein Roseis2KO_36110 [Roseivirga sp.]